ncbi:MAG: efflux RND transporter periplasmic adaptor subunit [FCB group bacterium]|nr:efflux RND transporter periplasmic adaptor subunit [FCB group bacterium]
MKKVMTIFALVVIVAAVLFFAMKGSASKEEGLKTFACEKGSIIDKALAVGTIVPRHEIAVKSKISGIVKRLYVEIGDEVKIGDPLMDIAPDPTPLELAEAKRQVEISQITSENAERELDRSQSLKDKKLISDQEFESAKAKCDEMKLRLKLSEEKLALIEEGQIKMASKVMENVIKSPIAGMVLMRNVDVGDPVVPLTSFQAGTELIALADMSDLMFRGTVDEIDVGKLYQGMNVALKIGALPESKVEGVLVKISPKAHRDEGSTVFNIEINLTNTGESLLRAGYSANADIFITKREDILLIPERLIEFVNDSSFVEVQDSLGTITKITIETGLSDGINIEVSEGLNEGDLLVERPPKEITGEM